MLRSPTAAAVDTTDESLVEHEYQKLKCAWEQQCYDTKLQQKQEETQHHPHDDAVQFTLMHLFHGYLNQIWMDSQNMLQCAQTWNKDPQQKDAAFTMNILGLHLMKQSLRTRQELFHIVDQASSNHQDAAVLPPATKRVSSSSMTRTSFCSVPSYYQLPVKLSSSPSTPTIHNAGNTNSSSHWQLDSATTTTTTPCKHAFTPGSNYPSYFPTEVGQNTSCHFCHEKLVGLKKSFSADHFSTLASQISSEETTSTINSSSSGSSDGEDSIETEAVYECFHDDISSSTLDLRSIDEDVLASRKLLIQDDDEEDEGNCCYQQKLLKYQLIPTSSELHESSKLELEDSASVSSSGTTIEELRMKRSTINNNLLHQRMDSSSTCLPESVYSFEDDCHCEQQQQQQEEKQTMPHKKRNLSMFFVNSKSSSKSSSTKSSFKDKLKRYRSSKDATDKNAMPRSFSNTLCQLFTSQSTSMSSHSSSSMRRQQAQLY